MAQLTAWYDDVAPYAGGCPLPVVLQKIREAAIAYCKLSRTWRYLTLGPIDALAAQQTYVIGTSVAAGFLPVDVVVSHVFQVNYNGAELDAVTPTQLKDKSVTWFNDAGDPEAFTLFKEGAISLWRIPSANAAAAIVIPEVALAPTQTAPTVDDSVFEHGRDAVAIGARARIAMIPGKPYSNLQLGEELERQFLVKCGAADLRAASGRGHARLRTRTIPR